MKIKIACFSDTHTKHDDVIIPECDFAIFAGDSTNVGERYDSIDFFNWFNKQHQAIHKIMIAGNHENKWDSSKYPRPGFLDKEFLEGNYPNIKYLENESINIWGANIYGSPYTPDFYPEYWGFNKSRGEEIRKEWVKIPDNTDILITHGPMRGHLDWINQSGRYGLYPDGHVGCVDLMDRVYQLPNLKLMVCGHIHNNTAEKDISIGDRTLKYVNAACLNNEYNFRYQPQVVEILI